MNPSVTIKVVSSAPELAKQFGRAAQKNLPFAMSKALNLTAKGSMIGARRQMKNSFTIRSPRVLKSLQFRGTHKRDFPNLVAHVGPQPKWMGLHITGGIKKAESGKKLAIPSKLVRRTSRGKVRASQKPGRILQKKGGDIAGGNIVQHFKTRPTKTFFFLRPRAKIKKTWDLRSDVEKSAQRQFGPIFRRELKLAILNKK